MMFYGIEELRPYFDMLQRDKAKILKSAAEMRNTGSSQSTVLRKLLEDYKHPSQKKLLVQTIRKVYTHDSE